MSRYTRREWLRNSGLGVSAVSLSGWLGQLAQAAAAPRPCRACIVLWMTGGPSQMDTFDLKPGHVNGGPYQEIQTEVPGIRFSEHLPRIAKQAKRLALLRSMSSKEGDHGRATFVAKTGYLPQGPIQYPPLGSLLAKELGHPDANLPSFVSIAPSRTLNPSAIGPGFLGPTFAPLIIGGTTARSADAADPDQALKVPDLREPSGTDAGRRQSILKQLQEDFLKTHRDAPPLSHQAAIDSAVRLMRPATARAFSLDEEPAALRDAYGRSLFGQGCLLARRLVERGVPFIEVSLGSSADGTSGWDTHYDNFDVVKRLSQVLDPAWSTLMNDLEARGLLDSTLLVWTGEFGRTPKINQLKGRDHYPAAFSAVLAGGGIKGGQVVGRTSRDGTTVEHRPITPPDFLSTICKRLDIDPKRDNNSNVGRPISIVDKAARPVVEVL